MTDSQPYKLGGTFVYHPLGPWMLLSSEFVSWTKPLARRKAPTGTMRLAAGSDRVRLLSLYRSQALAQNLRLRDPAARVTIPAEFDEDHRELTLYFDAFFTSFLEKTDLRDIQHRIAQVPLVFPVRDRFDARCINVDSGPAIFVTSRVLDVVELFAHTMSMCIRLNGLALPTLLGIEASEGHVLAHVPLAWMAMTAGGIPGLLLDDLLEQRSGADLERDLRDKIFSKYLEGWLPAPARLAISCYKLSHYLSQLMMHAVSWWYTLSRRWIIPTSLLPA